MIIQCSSCQSKYKYDESKLGGLAHKKVRCPKCQGVIEINLPASASTAQQSAKSDDMFDQTNPAPKTAKFRSGTYEGESASSAAAEADRYLKLPENKKISLAVIQGYNSGEIFQINKPKMIMGRSDSDIIVEDIEASRQHARIEVMGDRVVLRDLKSTNGTYLDDKKISFETLENHSEFRIGSTVFMLIITDLE